MTATIANAAASLPPLASETAPDSMRFVIEGRIVPYVRMTQRGKFVRPRAKLYLASQDAIRWQLKSQMAARGWLPLPERTPLWVSIEIWRVGGMHKCDMDNEAKAILDAAQGIVYRNDCWIDDDWRRRCLGNKDIARVEFEVMGGGE